LDNEKRRRTFGLCCWLSWFENKKTHNLGVGKTSFIVQLIHNHFDTDIEPTFQDDYQKTFNFDEIKIPLRMYDTTGWEGK
jgi:hypothetical protein